MTDPFASLKPFDGDAFATVDGLDLLDSPFDDVPDFDLEKNSEIDVTARLPADRSLTRLPTRRLFRDYRSNPDAFRHLKRLPKPGESMHMVISGKYALFDLVAAIQERTKEPIADLYLTTLGFSKQNGADLCDMLDAKQVRRVSMVCSYYFEKTSANIYDAVVPELLKRGQRVLAMRSHTKIILARMAGGARYVCESSANLRSCANVEQAVLSRCPRLYTFHRKWIEELFARKKAKDEHKN